MKLSQWAKLNGISYQTAFNLFKKGKMPCKAIQLETGTILVQDDNQFDKQNIKTYIYTRVSSYKNKDNLERQAERCLSFCSANGWEVEKIIKEVASGMNDKRPKLMSILDNNPKRIVVEHKDRLTRFGFNYFEKLFPLLNYELVVINRDQEDEQDLIKDMISIITSFCCRLYGLRRGNSKSNKIKIIINEKED